MTTAATIQEFGIQRENEERRDGGCAVVFDPVTQKYAVGRHSDHGAYWLFSGGVEKREEPEVAIMREVREESGLHDFLHIEKLDEANVHYFNRLKKVNRVAYATCYLVILKSTELVPRQLEVHETFELFWTDAEDILRSWHENNVNHDVDHWIYFLKKGVARARELGHDKTSVVTA